MRISLNFLLSAFFLLSAAQVRSSIIAPSPGCDTLITKMGQVILVQVLPSTDDKTVRFIYCGEENSEKTYEISRNNITEIRKTSAPAASLAAKQNPDTVKVAEEIPAGSAPVEPVQIAAPQELPKDSKPVLPEPMLSNRSINLYAKLAAIGGFGSLFLVAFAVAFSPFVFIMVLPLSIVGLVFSSMVLKRTKKWKADFLKQRRLAKWSMAMSISWIGLMLLYILLLILLFLVFFI